MWECVAALDLGDMAAHIDSEEKLHPHVKAPTSLPVPQLSSLSVTFLCSTKYCLASRVCIEFNVPPPRYPEVAPFGLQSE